MSQGSHRTQCNTMSEETPESSQSLPTEAVPTTDSEQSTASSSTFLGNMPPRNLRRAFAPWIASLESFRTAAAREFGGFEQVPTQQHSHGERQSVPLLQGPAAATGLDSATNAEEASGETSGSASEPVSLGHALLRSLSRGAHIPTEGSPEDGESTAAAAERHRLTSNTTGLDLQAWAQWLEKCSPFLCLLLLVFVFRHIVGIALFIWLVALLIKANDTVRKQVALKAERRALPLFAMGLLLLVHVAAVLTLLHRSQLWTRLALITPSSVPSVLDAVFQVTMVDLLVRCFGMVIKVCILIFGNCNSGEAFRRRSYALSFVEYVLLFYRALISTPVWFKYFEDLRMGIISSTITGLYLMFKASMLYERFMSAVSSVKTLASTEATYGKSATADETMEAGNMCAICQETMTQPIKLQCNHIFCDNCISEWFERERTCPMCRTNIKPPGANLYNDGSTAILPQLF